MADPPVRSLNLPLIGVALAASTLLVHVAVGADPRLVFSLDLIALAGVAVAGVGSVRAAADARKGVDEVREQLQALQRTASAQAQVIDGAGEAIIVIDDQATIFTFNRAAERMFGYQADEMIGSSLERLMTDGGRKAHSAYMAKIGVTAMVEAARLRTLHKGVRKRGDAFTFELHMTEWSDAGRRMFTGVIRDVSERENAADAARDANSRVTALFEASRDPLFVFTQSGDGGFSLEQMNAAAETCTGLSRFAAVGWPPEKLSGPGERRGLKHGLLECLSSGAELETDARLPSADGGVPARLTFTPMGDARAETRRVLVRGVIDPKLGRTRAA